MKQLSAMVNFFKNFLRRKPKRIPDTEIWDLDYALAEWLVPRLKRLRDESHGHPADITMKMWKQRLSIMIEGFSFVLSDDYHSLGEHNKIGREKLDLALQILKDNYQSLWD